jgi:DNA polymerase
MIDEDDNVVTRKNDAFKPDWLEGFVGKVAILALGFGQGHDAFTKTLAKGALGGPPVIISNAQGFRIVRKLYRGTYKEIPALWKKLDTLLRHMANPKLKPFLFEDCIWVEPYRLRMPNGLYLNYPGLKSVPNDDEGGFHFEYWNGRYWKDIYGAALAENICQCLARIVMSTQMLAIEKELKARYQGRVILTVHDEVIATVPTPHAEDALQLMLNTMRIAPSWCNTRGLVLDAEGGYAQNYSK